MFVHPVLINLGDNPSYHQLPADWGNEAESKCVYCTNLGNQLFGSYDEPAACICCFTPAFYSITFLWHVRFNQNLQKYECDNVSRFLCLNVKRACSNLQPYSNQPLSNIWRIWILQLYFPSPKLFLKHNWRFGTVPDWVKLLKAILRDVMGEEKFYFFLTFFIIHKCNYPCCHCIWSLQCIRAGYLLHIQPFSMEADWQEIEFEMEVSTVFHICTYCIFTL